ncbi:MAG: M23 family metallopeptidase [Helicobacteraceae bacterium]|nr:M23 family metallopeptidase [Helicobacteraceae bacterium]
MKIYDDKHYNPRRKQMIRLSIAIAIAAAAILFYIFAPQFESEPPKAALISEPFWNGDLELDLKITDNRAIAKYEIALLDTIEADAKEIKIASGDGEGRNEIALKIKMPDKAPLPKKRAALIARISDASWKNFGDGNFAEVKIDIEMDRRAPIVNIVATSYAISLGGSALAIFEAKDENLKEVSVKTRNGRTFVAAPFHKPNFYVALIARGIKDTEFTAYAVASDRAGNQNRARLPLYLKDTRYKESVLPLTKDFMEGKVDDLNFRYNPRYKEISQLEKFIYVNEDLRKESFDLIEKYTAPSKLPPAENFTIGAFRPLPNSKMVAGFGEHRIFTLEGKNVSESYHYGVDLASVKEANVFATNGGVAVFAGDNGVYGSMPIIHHGLGLFSLYGHCTDLKIAQGDNVRNGEIIGTTGITGFALGDHTHFETRVQGVPVSPLEWMDSAWIRANITKIEEEARKIIDGRSSN